MPISARPGLAYVASVPTASDYRRIAVRLLNARDVTTTMLQPVMTSLERRPFEGGGGQLERTVSTAVAVSTTNVADILAELQLQIGEAQGRALVCDGYEAAVRRYRRSTDPDRRYPSRPAAWVDHG